jgi:cbb3-type cytochrome oxidase subunit 3
MNSLILILISFVGSWYLYEPHSGDLVTDSLCALVLFVSFIALLIWIFNRVRKSSGSGDNSSWFDNDGSGGDGGGCD